MPDFVEWDGLRGLECILLASAGFGFPGQQSRFRSMKGLVDREAALERWSGLQRSAAWPSADKRLMSRPTLPPWTTTENSTTT